MNLLFWRVGMSLKILFQPYLHDWVFVVIFQIEIRNAMYFSVNKGLSVPK